jgi:ABC-type cobalamin transport system permease subunit
MTLHRLRFTVRRMMVVVALMALSMAVMTWFVKFINDLNQGMRDFYGPGGVLERQADTSRRSLGGSGPEAKAK